MAVRECQWKADDTLHPDSWVYLGETSECPTCHTKSG